MNTEGIDSMHPMNTEGSNSMHPTNTEGIKQQLPEDPNQRMMKGDVILDSS